jgi:hypothetical protein
MREFSIAMFDYWRVAETPPNKGGWKMSFDQTLAILIGSLLILRMVISQTTLFKLI